MKIIIKEFDVFISFNYNQEIIEKIKQIPSKSWDPNKKQWWLPKIFLQQFLDSIKGYPYEIVEYKKPINKVKADTFKFKTKPFQHQLDCFEWAKERERFLLGDEQGLGKTKQSIDVAVYRKLAYNVQHCLIVCGIKTLIYNWENEIKTHSYEESCILGARQQKRTGRTVYEGTKEKIQDLQDIDNLPYFLIINVEALRTKEITNKLKELIKLGKIGMIIFDEFHKVKNSESLQGKAILELNTPNKIACTGTPLMNSPLDLYPVLYWIGIEKHNFYQFRNYYCVLNNYKAVIGYKHQKELNLKLETIMLRRKKDEVLDLPPKIYTTEYLEMSNEQWGIYNEIKNDIVENIDKVNIKSLSGFTELIRLRQATAFTGILSENIRVSVKYDRVFDYLEEVVLNNGKLIIFSLWKEVINPLYKVLEAEGYNPAIISGDVKPEERKIQETKFMYDDSCKVILGTMASMGTGLTLTAANTVIFLDEPWNKATKEQCEDRTHRIGTKGAVSIITLIAKDTVDEGVHDVVYVKGLLSDAVVDGEIKGKNSAEIMKMLLRL